MVVKPYVRDRREPHLPYQHPLGTQGGVLPTLVERPHLAQGQGSTYRATPPAMRLSPRQQLEAPRPARPAPSNEDMLVLWRLAGGDEVALVELMARLWQVHPQALAPGVRAWLEDQRPAERVLASRTRSSPAPVPALGGLPHRASNSAPPWVEKGGREGAYRYLGSVPSRPQVWHVPSTSAAVPRPATNESGGDALAAHMAEHRRMMERGAQPLPVRA